VDTLRALHTRFKEKLAASEKVTTPEKPAPVTPEQAPTPAE
jgi:hypothetical protein